MPNQLLEYNGFITGIFVFTVCHAVTYVYNISDKKCVKILRIREGLINYWI